jgi:hypothetical protein
MERKTKIIKGTISKFGPSKRFERLSKTGFVYTLTTKKGFKRRKNFLETSIFFSA